MSCKKHTSTLEIIQYWFCVLCWIADFAYWYMRLIPKRNCLTFVKSYLPFCTFCQKEKKYLDWIAIQSHLEHAYYSWCTLQMRFIMIHSKINMIKNANQGWLLPSRHVNVTKSYLQWLWSFCGRCRFVLKFPFVFPCFWVFYFLR